MIVLLFLALSHSVSLCVALSLSQCLTAPGLLFVVSAAQLELGSGSSVAPSLGTEAGTYDRHCAENQGSVCFLDTLYNTGSTDG